MKVAEALVRLLHGSNITSAIHPVRTLDGRACNGNPYCVDLDGKPDRWTNDCGLEKPSTKGFMDNRSEMVRYFSIYFNEYNELRNNGTLEKDELTLPLFLAKRLAPNMSPSALICDGRSKCQIPSCDDLGQKLTKRERQIAWYIFEYLSILDHSQRAIYEGTNEFFAFLLIDMKNFVRMFSYSDEQQSMAQKKAEQDKMILALVVSFALLACAALGGPGLMPVVEAGTATAGKAVRFATLASKFTKWSKNMKPWSEAGEQWVKMANPVSSFIPNSYIGLQGLAVLTFDPEHQYDSLVEALQERMAHIQDASLKQLTSDNLNLMTGGTTHNGLSLLEMFSMGKYQEVDVGMSARLRSLMIAYYSAMAINVLWQREGTYIVETELKGRTCVEDDRGHYRNRVCLRERPNTVYWIFAVARDKEQTIVSPPGFWNLGNLGYRELQLEDVVRSSLWKEEIWDQQAAEERMDNPAEIMNVLIQPLQSLNMTMKEDSAEKPPTFSNKHLEPLEHYGLVPGTMTIPICRSPKGLAISSVNIDESVNAPCICDAFGSASTSWATPEMDSWDATDRFLKWTKLYENEKYLKLCTWNHQCDSVLSYLTWKERLGLEKHNSDNIFLRSHWSRCRYVASHDRKGLQRE